MQKSRDNEDDVEEVELEYIAFSEIDKLQEGGINAADITKLKAAGYCTVSSVIMATRKELCNIKGFNEGKIDKVQEIARKIENANFITGNELVEKRKNIVRITTGSPVLD